MNSPLLSIVIANYNYGRFIEDAIRSVILQATDEIELIICDAASTDNSVDVIKKYTGGLPSNTERNDPSILHLHLTPTPISWWCSEPDGGQSAAFNKGFSHARGKYLTWLNADDVLVPGCLKHIIVSLKKHPKCEWFTGNFYRYKEDGTIIEVGWGPHWYPFFLQHRDSPIVVFGPTSFFAKSAYERLGRIDESLHYVMDIDLWRRFMAAGVKQRRINCFCWGFRMHASSKTAEYDDHRVDPVVEQRMEDESLRVRQKVGYQNSKVLRFLSLLFRALDLSIVRSLYYKRCLRRVSQLEGGVA